MASIAKDISTLLTSITTDIYIDELQDKDKDNCIAVFHSTGRASSHTFGDSKPIENPSVQVRIRHKNRETALQWCNSVKDILDGKYNFTIGSNYYLLVNMSGDILSLGRDAQGRVQYSLNFDIQMKRY